MLSLHISTSRAWRGTETHVMHIVLGLRELGQRAVLVAHPDGELRRRLSEGLDVIPLAPSQDVDLAAAWRLSRVLRQLRPDVIHVYDQHAVSMAAVGLSITAPTPRPALVISRRIDVRLPHHSFAKWKYGEADCFIANSAALRNRLVADGVPAPKIRVVHEGVDVDRIQKMSPVDVHAEFYLPHNAPVIGSVGALVAQKGHAHLIDAAARVVREVPDARFVIVGDGELHAALEDQIRHRHLERHVFLAGFRADAVAMTKAFDIFAASPVHEGLPIALVDAMAAAKPAVATRVGGIPEVMIDRETGFMVEPRDPDAMADRLVALLKDPALRARMGDAALARAREKFSVERMVAATAAVYKSLAADIANRAAAD